MNQQDEEEETLNKMFEVLEKSNPVYHPSALWIRENKEHLEFLRRSGYSNFKRTLGFGYGSSMITSPIDNWFINLFLKWLKNPKFEIFTSKFEGEMYHEKPTGRIKLNKRHLFVYKLFVSMLWEYIKSVDKEGLLEKLEEPIEGNPPRVFYKGRLISQDLCKSISDYYTITDHLSPDEKNNLTIAEVGGGYGRLAYVFLRATKCKYICVDIPPALHVCQRYLSAVFPDLKILKFRDFRSYSEIKSEYESADICIFTPNQMELLPKREFNLFINIASLAEMRMDTIKHYFHLINEHCKGYFYTQQYLEPAKTAPPDIQITYKDYPIPPNWKTIFFRKHPIRPNGFDALYAVNPEV